MLLCYYLIPIEWYFKNWHVITQRVVNTVSENRLHLKENAQYILCSTLLYLDLDECFCQPAKDSHDYNNNIFNSHSTKHLAVQYTSHAWFITHKSLCSVRPYCTSRVQYSEQKLDVRRIFRVLGTGSNSFSAHLCGDSRPGHFPRVKEQNKRSTLVVLFSWRTTVSWNKCIQGVIRNNYY